MSTGENNTGIGGFTFRHDQASPGYSEPEASYGAPLGDADTEENPIPTLGTHIDPEGNEVHSITGVGRPNVGPETDEISNEEVADEERRRRRGTRVVLGLAGACLAMVPIGMVAIDYANDQAAEQFAREREKRDYSGPAPSASQSVESSESPIESPSPSASQTTSPEPSPSQTTLESRKDVESTPKVIPTVTPPTRQQTQQPQKPKPTKTASASPSACGWPAVSVETASVSNRCGGRMTAYKNPERTAASFDLYEGMQVTYRCIGGSAVEIAIANETAYADNATVGNIC